MRPFSAVGAIPTYLTYHDYLEALTGLLCLKPKSFVCQPPRLGHEAGHFFPQIMYLCNTENKDHKLIDGI